jgi:hypothetical protein
MIRLTWLALLPWAGLGYNADYGIMPTETSVIWSVGPFPGTLGSPRL